LLIKASKEWQKASQNYELASKAYLFAIEKIPQLKELILMMVLFSTVPTIVASIIFERRVKSPN